jgi:hypothetical protein
VPNIRKLLDLSTNHLPEPIMQDPDSFDGVIAHTFDHGAFLWVPNDVDAHNNDYENFPEEVAAVQRYARSHGCDYVLLDADAGRDPALPTWEW